MRYRATIDVDADATPGEVHEAVDAVIRALLIFYPAWFAELDDIEERGT